MPASGREYRPPWSRQFFGNASGNKSTHHICSPTSHPEREKPGRLPLCWSCLLQKTFGLPQFLVQGGDGGEVVQPVALFDPGRIVVE